MKKIMLSLLSMFLMLQISNAQWKGGKSISGNGNVQKENREVGTFDKVAVGSGIDLYIEQGSSNRVEVEADENVIPVVKTEVKGNTLKIYSEKGWRNVKKVRVNVTMKDIREITASGGSDAYSVGTLESSNLVLRGSGGSDLELNINVGDLDCTVSGGSDAELEGKASDCQMRASGGSDIKAYDLKTARCDVSASGGSDAYVMVSEQIDLSASGGSDVHYKGNAKIGRKSVSGSSDVHH